MADQKNLDLKHVKFTEWVKDQGVLVDGVRPASFPGKGLGIVASKRIKKGDVLIRVPTRLLIFVDPVASKRGKNTTNISIHGRLALVLVDEIESGDAAKHALWMGAMPTKDEMKRDMPIFWSKELQSCLPDVAKTMLQKQSSKMERDALAAKDTHEKAKAMTSEETEIFVSTFRYVWMLVNSRTFYWDYPTILSNKRSAKARELPKRLPRDDCMALCPFVDYFNHSNGGCPVTYGAEGFDVTSDADYELGDEINVSYGDHSNDFLLIEYGFVMDDNMVDHTKLDKYITTRLSEEQKEQLRDENLLGNYTIDHSGVCHRTQSALRLIVLPFRKWERFVSGHSDGERDQAQVDKLCAEIINEYLDDVDTVSAQLASQENSSGKDTLQKRYTQVRNILKAALTTLKDA